MLTRITIENFKSHIKTSIPLITNNTSIIGANGTGKSNIIESVKFLLTDTDFIYNNYIPNTLSNSNKNIKITAEFKNKTKLSKILTPENAFIYEINSKEATKEEYYTQLTNNNIHKELIQSQLKNISYLPILESLTSTKQLREKFTKEQAEVKNYQILQKHLKSQLKHKYYTNVQQNDHKIIEENILPALTEELENIDNFSANVIERNKKFITKKYKQKEKEILTELQTKEVEIKNLEQKLKKTNKISKNINRKEITNQLKEIDIEILEQKKKDLKNETIIFVENIVEKNGEEYLKNLEKALSSNENSVSEYEKISKLFFTYCNKDVKQFESLKTNNIKLFESLKEKFFELRKRFVYEKEHKISQFELEDLPKSTVLDNQLTNKALILKKSSETKNLLISKKNQLEQKVSSLEKYKLSLETKTKLEDNTNEEIKEVLEFLGENNFIKKETIEQLEYQNLIEFESFLKSLENPNLKIELEKTDDKIYGNLIDLIKFNKKYYKAVIGTLGGMANAIITRDRKTSVKCLKRFKNKFNRMIFLDLDSYTDVVNTNTDININNLNNIININKILDYEKKFSPIFSNIFKDVFIVENLDEIKNLKKIKYKKIVTLDGHTLNSKGVYSSFKNIIPSSVIQKHLQTIQSLKIQNTKKNSINEKLNDLKDLLKNYDSQHNSLTNMINRTEQEIEESNNFITALNKQKKQLDYKNENLKILKNEKTEKFYEFLENEKFLRQNFSREFLNNYSTKQKLEMLEKMFEPDFKFDNLKNQLKKIKTEYKTVCEDLNNLNNLNNLSSVNTTTSINNSLYNNSLYNSSVNINNVNINKREFDLNVLAELIKKTNSLKTEIISLRHKISVFDSGDFSLLDNSEILIDESEFLYSALKKNFHCKNCNKNSKKPKQLQLTNCLNQLKNIPMDEIKQILKGFKLEFDLCLNCCDFIEINKKLEDFHITNNTTNDINNINSNTNTNTNINNINKNIKNKLEIFKILTNKVINYYNYLILALNSIENSTNENLNTNSSNLKLSDHKTLKNFFSGKLKLNFELNNLHDTIKQNLTTKTAKQFKEFINSVDYKQLSFYLTDLSNFITESKNEIKKLTTSYSILINQFLKELTEVVNRNYQKMKNDDECKIELSVNTNNPENELKILVKNSKEISAFVDSKSLSGGEKSLIDWNILLALALKLSDEENDSVIFIDELDCFLDLANLQNISKLLEEIKNKVQIVLVTHKQKIFENSEALIGVYKSNEDVGSQILTIKL